AKHPVVVFGIDVLTTCMRSAAHRGAGQFAVVLKAGDRPTLVAKRFPTPAEDAYLRVPARPAFPACGTPLGRAAAPAWHDVNVYSPRGTATTVDQGRAGRRAAFKDAVRVAAPAFGLHLAHCVETAASFRQAYARWNATVGVPLFGVSGLPANIAADDAAG